MELKFTNRILNNQAFILLNDEITQGMAAMIAEEMYWLKAQGHDLVMKINSVGGNVLAGYSLIDAIVTTKADTHIIGIAASMAGVIAQFGNKRLANDNAIGMIHPPSGKGDKNLKEMIRTQLTEMLSNRSKFTSEDVAALMEDGAGEKFYNATEMLELGLIDEIVQTNQPTPMNQHETINEMELFNFYNKAINKDQNKMADFNKLKNALNLNEDASVEKVTETVNKMQADLNKEKEESKKLKDENTELENKVTTLEAEVKNYTDEKVETLISNAVKEGRISEEGKDQWKDLANKDFKLAEQTLSSMSVSSGPIGNFLDDESGVKNFAQMSEDEKVKMARENPEAYNKMLMAENK